MREEMDYVLGVAAGVSVVGLFLCSIYAAVELSSLARAQWVETYWQKRQAVALETACEEHAP